MHYNRLRLHFDGRNSTGGTPPHMAARLGKPELIQVPLDAGADPKPRDGEGRLPADIAGKNERIRNDSAFREPDEARKSEGYRRHGRAPGWRGSRTGLVG